MNSALPPPAPTSPVQPAPGQRREGPFRGWLLIVLGLGLSVAMGGATFYLGRTIALQNTPGVHDRWTGSPEFTRLTFALFGVIFAFGLVCIGAGAFQVATGRRHWGFFVPILLLAAVMVYLGYAITHSR